MTPETLKEIQLEFSRQAQPMACAPVFREQAVLQRLVRAVGGARSGRVLDLACGPGIVAEAVAPHVGQLIGIDATPEMIWLASRQFERANLKNGRFALAAAESLPFEGGTFDEVITRLSFHHFAEASVVAAEARRVLQRAGRLIVADIVSSADPEESRLHNSLERLRDQTHVRMLPAQELLDTIRMAGFCVLREETWTQPRTFSEWAAIVKMEARIEPLQNIMRALARAGQTAGIALREEEGELRFAHTWILIEAMSD